jgi:hypothetical protein
MFYQKVLVSNDTSRFPLFLKETLHGGYLSCALTSRIEANQLKPVGNRHVEHIFTCLHWFNVNYSPSGASLLEHYALKNSPTLPTLVVTSYRQTDIQTQAYMFSGSNHHSSQRCAAYAVKPEAIICSFMFMS